MEDNEYIAINDLEQLEKDTIKLNKVKPEGNYEKTKKMVSSLKNQTSKNIKLRVSISQIEKIGELIEEFANKLKGIRNEYENIMLNIKANWEDEASAKFALKAEEFDEESLKTLETDMMRGSEDILESAEKYKQLM